MGSTSASGDTGDSLLTAQSQIAASVTLFITGAILNNETLQFDNGNGGLITFTFKDSASTATHFLVSGPSTATAGAAFNITILSNILGTTLQPDFSDHVLMLEDVGEYMYRIDRALFHITSNPSIRRVKGIMLGRCSDITANEPDFAMNEEEVARTWCDRSGIPWLGRADIGHDADNKIVPFGRSV